MKKIIIIGNHAAGLSAAEVLRKGDDSSEITIISKENVPPYSRCLIPFLVSGEKSLDDILHKPKTFYKDYSINTKFDKEVVNILTKEKAVILSDGDKISYDNLIVATGGTPSTLNIPGVENEGVFSFRTLEDAEKIIKYCDKVKTAVVLGGGLIGIKAAVALQERGLKVKILVGSSNILSQIVTSIEAEIIEEYLRKKGIEILTGKSPSKILGKGKVEGIETKDGEKIDCQLAIIGKGVRANTNIVKDTDIKIENGIIINEHCQTNVPDIYAAGDVTQSPDTIRKKAWTNALWPHAVEEGRVAAENILGINSNLNGRTSMNSIKIGDIALISCGLTGARENMEGVEEITIKNSEKNNSKRFLIKKSCLVGFSLVGDVRHAGVLKSLVTKEVNIEKIKDVLISGVYDFPSILPLIKENKEKFNEPEYQEVLAFF